jgi:hypothetical protein
MLVMETTNTLRVIRQFPLQVRVGVSARFHFVFVASNKREEFH